MEPRALLAVVVGAVQAESAGPARPADPGGRGGPVHRRGCYLLSADVGLSADMGTPADLSKLKAVIDWGNATMPAAGTIASMGMGASTSYVVSGQHIYKDNGLYPVTVTITGGTPPSTSGMGTAQVAATPIQAAGTVITPVLGQPSPDLTVASFVDPNPFETVDDFVAFVDFGDGQTGAGTVVPDGNGRFRVTASHTYTSLPMAMETSRRPSR